MLMTYCLRDSLQPRSLLGCFEGPRAIISMKWDRYLTFLVIFIGPMVMVVCWTWCCPEGINLYLDIAGEDLVLRKVSSPYLSDGALTDADYQVAGQAADKASSLYKVVPTRSGILNLLSHKMDSQFRKAVAYAKHFDSTPFSFSPWCPIHHQSIINHLPGESGMTRYDRRNPFSMLQCRKTSIGAARAQLASRGKLFSLVCCGFWGSVLELGDFGLPFKFLRCFIGYESKNLF